METKNILIIVIVIVIIAAVAGVMISSQSHAKQDSKIAIISNQTLNEGGNLTVKLTSANGTEISGQNVKITIENKTSVRQTSVMTNAKGIGELPLDEKAGNYTINCTFDGNENYNGSSTHQKLEIKGENVETQETSTVSQNSTNSSSSDNIHYDKDLNVYYNDEGIVVDPDGKHPMEVGRKYSELVERKEKYDRGELEM